MTRAIFMGATCSHACPSAAAGFSFLFPREDGLGPVGRHESTVRQGQAGHIAKPGKARQGIIKSGSREWRA